MKRNKYCEIGMPDGRFMIPRFLPEILIPVLAVAALLIILFWPRDGTVEFNIPVSVLIEDGDIAGFVIAGTVDEQMLKELTIVEDYLSSHYENAIDELTREEVDRLIIALDRKYGSGM